jgi:uncharacterized glyoxalase superfamily protein PhnB
MSTTKPIPDGFHTMTPHLVCRDAAKAIAFYEKAFGAKELGRSLMPDGKSIMHAMLQFGDSRLMLADEFPQWKSLGPLAIGGTAVTLHLYVEDTDQVYKRAIDAGATSKMAPTDMFWGDRYAQVVDPSGHMWAIATHIKDVSPAEMEKAAREAMAKMGG